MTGRTHVLLADVPGAGQRAIAALLRSLPGIVLVAQVDSADQLARERPRTAPDVVVIDDRLLAAAAPRLGQADVPIIVMGLDDDPSYARRAHRLGAIAWIAKERADELLPDALDRARRQASSPSPWREPAVRSHGETATSQPGVPDALRRPSVEYGGMAETDTPRILVAGGGVAGLEACLALRSFLGEAELDIDLLCREDRFEYRPLAVLEPFEGAPAWSMKLERFAADQDVRLMRDALVGVDLDRHVAITAHSGPLSYDALLVCVGARPVRALPGALTFRGGRDAAAVRAALDAVGPGEEATIAFAVPFGTFWTLPLYELAILAAARLQTRGTRAQVVMTSPEGAPLEAFGAAASTAVAALLDAHGIEFTSRARAIAADAGELELDDGRRIRATAVITLPNLVGRRVPGVPQDAEGFIAVDDHGRVPGADDVYAAGDITTFPLKQGGLATQQADAAAEAILAALGVPIVPRPFEPVLKGVLYTDREPAYLRAAVGGKGSQPRAYSMWWPPGKIAGRHLAPYLATRAGAPRAPEVRPERDAIAVDVDVPGAVRGVANALDPSAVPPA